MFNILILLFSTIILTSCGEPIDSPLTVSEKYWSALQQNNHDVANLLMSKHSQSISSTHLESLNNINFENFVVDNPKTTITTIINPDADSPGDEIIFETRLVLEDGSWKIDLYNTHIPQAKPKTKDLNNITKELEKTIQKNVDSIEDVMGEGINILNEALKQGSEEMGKSMLDAINELNQKIKKSIDKMKERRQKKQSPNDSNNDDSGEGLI